MRVVKNEKNIFNGIAHNLICGKDYEDFYNYKINDEKELFRRLDFVKKSEFDREGLVKALLHYNEKVGAGKKVIDNINSLISEETYVVVTGQQAGYFAGPLYTVFKAMTTIKLAKEYSDKLNKKVVPVFWIASEDHDFHEVSRIAYSNENKMKKVKFKKHDDRNISVGNMEIDENFLYEMKCKMVDIVDDEEFEKLFLSTIEVGQSYSLWFGKIMTKLFSEYGLVLIDSMEKSKRKLEKEFFIKALKDNNKVGEVFKNQTEKLIEKGYQPLIVNNELSSNIFIQHNGERIQLLKNEEKFESEIHGISYTVDELIKLAEETPEIFSTNVVLRPVVQDYVLPNLAYVAGPGEMKYYGQLKKVYGVFDLEMPIIYPRENFTYISRKIADKMEKYNINLDKVFHINSEIYIKDYIKELTDDKVEKSFRIFSEHLSKNYSEMIDSLDGISNVDQDVIERNKKQIEKQLSYLKNKVNQNIRKDNKESIGDIRGVFDFVHPENGLQERTHSVVSVIDGIEKMLKLIYSINIDYNHRVLIDIEEE